MGLWDTVKRIGTGIATGGISEFGPGGVVGNPLSQALDRSAKAEELYGGVDPNGDMRGMSEEFARHGSRGMDAFHEGGGGLNEQRKQMQGISDNFQTLGRRYGAQFGQLAGQYGDIASGKNSIAAEQLRQGLLQSQGQQMGMAAAARPQDASMAALMAGRNMSDQAMGMGGQAAAAGLQERRDAMGAQMGAIGAGANARMGFLGGAAGMQNAMQQGRLDQRGQNLQAGLGGMQGAMQGYGGIEQARTNRYSGLVGMPTYGEHLLSGAQGAAQYATVASDPRLKKNVRSGEKDADDLVKALKSVTYGYKDSKHGEGEFTGIMTSDLKKTRAGRAAVIETPDGEMVHGARLATALAATLPGLDKRIAKLEKRRGR